MNNSSSYKQIILPRNVRRALGNTTSTVLLWPNGSPSKECINDLAERLFACIVEYAEPFHTWRYSSNDGIRLANTKLKEEILSRFGRDGSNEIYNFAVVSADAERPKKHYGLRR